MIIAFSVNLSHEQTPLCEEIVAPSCKSLFTSKFSERIKRANSENANLLLVFATFCQCLTSLAGVWSSTFVRTLYLFRFSFLSTCLFNLTEFSRHSVSSSLFIHLSVVAGDQRDISMSPSAKGSITPLRDYRASYNSSGHLVWSTLPFEISRVFADLFEIPMIHD